MLQTAAVRVQGIAYAELLYWNLQLRFGVYIFRYIYIYVYIVSVYLNPQGRVLLASGRLDTSRACKWLSKPWSLFRSLVEYGT